MTTTTANEWHTLRQAASVTGVSSRTLRRQINAGELRARRIGRIVRITDVELTRWALDTDRPATVERAVPSVNVPVGTQPGATDSPAVVPGTTSEVHQ